MQTPPRKALGLLLSVLAGYVDAVGYLLLGGVFVAFMSGNTTRLGIALAQGAAWAGWAAVIAAFVGGACAGTLLRDAAGRWALPLLLAAEAGLLALAAIPIDPAVPLAMAMGLQNMARQAVAGATPGTTFVTGTLVGLGQALADLLRRRPDPALGWQAATWAALLAGTALGAAAVAGLGGGLALGLAPAPLAAFALWAAFRTSASYRRPD